MGDLFLRLVTYFREHRLNKFEWRCTRGSQKRLTENRKVEQHFVISQEVLNYSVDQNVEKLRNRQHNVNGYYILFVQPL